MDGLRSRLPSAAGAPRFSWFVRVDRQVAEGFGSPVWALAHYARAIDGLQLAGDELGIHSHAFRWDTRSQAWIIDHGNQAGVERTLREAFAAFEDAMGFGSRTFRFGDHWMNDATVRLLEELGVAIDLTLEPGMPEVSSLIARERHTGAITDLTAVPRTPYRPSARDFRTADPNRTGGIWIMPVTTGRLPAPVRQGRALYRWLTRAPDAGFDVLALNLALAPVLFRAIAAPILGADPPPCLVLPIRSDVGARPHALRRLQANIDYLLRHPLRDRFAFCTAVQALELIHPGTRLSGSGTRRKALAGALP